jgi:hypothetical protein
VTHAIYSFVFWTGKFLDANSPFPFPFAESLGDTRNYSELRETHKADMQFRGKVVCLCPCRCLCSRGGRDTTTDVTICCSGYRPCCPASLYLCVCLYLSLCLCMCMCQRVCGCLSCLVYLCRLLWTPSPRYVCVCMHVHVSLHISIHPSISLSLSLSHTHTIHTHFGDRRDEDRTLIHSSSSPLPPPPRRSSLHQPSTLLPCSLNLPSLCTPLLPAPSLPPPSFSLSISLSPPSIV